MDTSIFLARLFSLYFIVLGIALVFNKAHYRRTIEEVLRDDSLLFFMAIITLIMGILLVFFHNMWVSDWRVIITLLAWLVFIKGIVRLWFPRLIRKMAKMFSGNGLYYVVAIIMVLGLYLGCKGFIQ